MLELLNIMPTNQNVLHYTDQKFNIAPLVPIPLLLRKVTNKILQINNKTNFYYNQVTLVCNSRATKTAWLYSATPNVVVIENSDWYSILLCTKIFELCFFCLLTFLVIYSMGYWVFLMTADPQVHDIKSENTKYALMLLLWWPAFLFTFCAEEACRSLDAEYLEHMLAWEKTCGHITWVTYDVVSDAPVSEIAIDGIFVPKAGTTPQDISCFDEAASAAKARLEAAWSPNSLNLASATKAMLNFNKCVAYKNKYV